MNSKRDISGVRTAQDLERKLGLADIRKATEQARIGVTKTNQTLNDFINTSLEEFMKLQDKIDDKAEIALRITRHQNGILKTIKAM